jgi:hypothetical protein
MQWCVKMIDELKAKVKTEAAHAALAYVANRIQEEEARRYPSDRNSSSSSPDGPSPSSSA